VKKDFVIAIVAIAVVAAICFGVAQYRHALPPSLAHPFSSAPAETKSAASAGSDNVIMHVNGEPITQREYDLFIQSLPEQMQAAAQSDAGKRQLADRIVKLKVLEQEGKRLGAENDPDVIGRIDFGKANVIADYAYRKLATPPTDAQLRAVYDKEKESYSAMQLSHIVVAYQGGQVPARKGATPPFEQAMQKAQALEAKLKAGADFAALAKAESDDTRTAPNGGSLGPVTPSMLGPQLEQVITHLPPGGVTQPMRTEFGIHIFKPGSRQPEAFENVKATLQQKVSQDQMAAKLKDLQAKAKVEMDPKFFPPPSAGAIPGGLGNPGGAPPAPAPQQ
jgi:parvulin-like peptidyl-prolyl isomerase